MIRMVMTRVFMPIVVGALVSLTIVGCADAQMGKLSSLGDYALVTQYSGGEKVNQWCSTGKVMSEKESDGYYFVRQSNDQPIDVSGAITIEYNHEKCS